MNEVTTQTIRGTVVKVCSSKTIRVEDKVTKIHPLYRKRYSQNRHFIVHDENSSHKVGDEVTIVSCRPISKNKSWCVQESK